MTKKLHKVTYIIKSEHAKSHFHHALQLKLLHQYEKNLLYNYAIDKTYSKTEEKSETLLRTPTSFISTNSGCIVVECMPSLWKNSLTFSANFIYSDKFLHLKNTMQQSVKTNLNHVQECDELQILYWPISYPTS